VGTPKKEGDGGAGAVKEVEEEEEEVALEARESDKQELSHKLEVMTEDSSTNTSSTNTTEVSANKHAPGLLLQEVAGNKAFASENAEPTSKIEMLTDKCEKDAAGQTEEGDGRGGAVKKEGKEEEEEEEIKDNLLAELKRARDDEVQILNPKPEIRNPKPSPL
jgi:hypothetical protein